MKNMKIKIVIISFFYIVD